MHITTVFCLRYLDIERLNHTHMVLIRAKGASTAIDYKPISLLNMIYKIITKTLIKD